MHMTCTIIQREKYQKRAVDIEIDNDRCSSQVEGVMHYIQYYDLSATSLRHKYSKASRVKYCTRIPLYNTRHSFTPTLS